MMIAKALTTGTIIGLAPIGTPAIATPADTVSTHALSTDVNAPSMTYYKLDDSQLGLGSDTYTFDVAKSGVATATNDATGVSEVLPGQASDVHGQTVTLRYEETAAGELIVSAVDPNAPNGASDGDIVATSDFNPAQRALGTVGGAGAGGLAGAAIGTVTLPVVGTVGAGAVGLVGGGVFGGMTGAAASCFG